MLYVREFKKANLVRREAMDKDKHYDRESPINTNTSLPAITVLAF